MFEGVVDLADGRRLAYAEFGPRDAPPILYFHGFPGCRRELRLIEPVLDRRAVAARVIALNRPGCGPSTFKPVVGFVDRSDDVAQAAVRLGLERFAVVGASGGAPFALASAYAMPERVTRVGIVVGLTPLDAPGMREAAGIKGIPKNAAVRRMQLAAAAFAVRTSLGRRMVAARLHRGRGEAERRMLQRPDVEEWLLDVTREALADGGGAAAHEAGLYLEPWDFDVADVTTETLLWYGGADASVPATAGRWLAGRLPNSRFTLWPEHGHFTWAASDEAADVVEAMTRPPFESPRDEDAGVREQPWGHRGDGNDEYGYRHDPCDEAR